MCASISGIVIAAGGVLKISVWMDVVVRAFFPVCRFGVLSCSLVVVPFWETFFHTGRVVGWEVFGAVCVVGMGIHVGVAGREAMGEVREYKDCVYEVMWDITSSKLRVYIVGYVLYGKIQSTHV